MRTLFAALALLLPALPAQHIGNLSFSSDVTIMPTEWDGKPAFLLLLPRDESRDQHQRQFIYAADDLNRKSYGARVHVFGLLDLRPCMIARVGWRGRTGQRGAVHSMTFQASPGVPFWTTDGDDYGSLLRYEYHGNPYIQRNPATTYYVGCYCGSTDCDAPCYEYDGHPQPEWMFMLVTIEALN